MPFPQNMVYVRWEFAWVIGAADVEIQDFGLWGVVTQEGTPAFPDWQPTVDAIAKKGVQTWIANAAPASYSSRLVMRRCVAYHYDQAHNIVLDRGEYVAADPDDWSGSADPLPPENSVCVSTYAFDPAGFQSQPARHRGRYYPPTPGKTTVSDTGMLDSATQGSLLAAHQAFLNAMTGVLDIDGASPLDDTHWRPYVNSVRGQMANKVGWIRVGRVVDTQRRRRNALTESYLTGTINT
jgi:hypothetical protein